MTYHSWTLRNNSQAIIVKKCKKLLYAALCRRCDVIQILVATLRSVPTTAHGRVRGAVAISNGGTLFQPRLNLSEDMARSQDFAKRGRGFFGSLIQP